MANKVNYNLLLLVGGAVAVMYFWNNNKKIDENKTSFWDLFTGGTGTDNGNGSGANPQGNANDNNTGGKNPTPAKDEYPTDTPGRLRTDPPSYANGGLVMDTTYSKYNSNATNLKIIADSQGTIADKTLRGTISILENKSPLTNVMKAIGGVVTASPSLMNSGILNIQRSLRKKA